MDSIVGYVKNGGTVCCYVLWLWRGEKAAELLKIRDSSQGSDLSTWVNDCDILWSIGSFQ